MKRALVVVCLLALTHVGCSSEVTGPSNGGVGDSNPAQKPGPFTGTGTVMIAADGTRMVGDSVAIDIRKDGEEDHAEMSVLAKANNQLITALVQIDPALIKAGGEAQATIAQVPLAIGIGWVERQRQSAATVRGTTGSIDYSLTGRRVAMSIDGDTPDLSATLAASVEIRCWVAPQELGLQPNGQLTLQENGQGPVGQLVLDQFFKSGYCAPYKF